MVTALVLIQAERSRIAQTAQALADLPHVSEVYSVTGEWDIVAVIKLSHYEELDDVVTGQLHQLEGLLKTTTMLAFRSYSKALLDGGFAVGLADNGPAEDSSR